MGVDIDGDLVNEVDKDQMEMVKTSSPVHITPLEPRQKIVM